MTATEQPEKYIYQEHPLAGFLVNSYRQDNTIEITVSKHDLDNIIDVLNKAANPVVELSSSTEMTDNAIAQSKQSIDYAITLIKNLM